MKRAGKILIVLTVLVMALVSCKQSDPLLDTYWIAGSDMVHFKNETELDVYVCHYGLDGTKLEQYEYRHTWKYVFDGEIIIITEEDGTVQNWTLKGDYIVLFVENGVEITAKKANF